MAERVVDNTDIIEIGNNIQNYRKEKGLSQNKLAEIVNLAGNSMHRIESATVVMGIDKLIAIADALEISPNELLPERFLKKGDCSSDGNKQEPGCLRLWDKLTDANKNIVLTMMKMLVEQQAQ